MLPPVNGLPGSKLIAKQGMSGPHSGERATITPGDPMDRAMGQYGKAPQLLAGGDDPTAGAPPAPAASNIRGGAGVMRRRVSKGGFGGPTSPGTM